LHAIINSGPLADLTQDEYARLKADIIAAESTCLKPKLFDPFLSPYLRSAFIASSWGYAAAFLAVSLLGIVGCVLAWRAGRSRTEVPSRAESSVDTEGVADLSD
jgi:hypothetical protein